MRNFIGLISFFISILAALFSDGRMEPKFLVPYAGFLFVGLITMSKFDQKVVNFFKDLGQIRVTRRF